MVNQISWEGCYGKQWSNLVVSGLSRHPAKFSRALIYRIAHHMLERGWVAQGDTVLDPFGGAALGAIPLIERGVNWAGMELEEHFVKLGQSNIDLWNKRYARSFKNWGRASLYWGDSRFLLPELARARFGAVVGSPPYEKTFRSRGHGIDEEKFGRERDKGRTVSSMDAIGNGYAGVMGSPPYADHIGGDADPKSRGGVFRDPKRAGDASLTAEYGNSDGQLGAMDDDGFAAALGSPPYGGSDMRGGDTDAMLARRITPTDGYGKSAGQLGHTQGDTFWSAAKLIVASCRDVLRTGGVAVWVVKNYARNWEIVPFCDRWLKLNIACGLEHIETITAHQVKHKGVVQLGLLGDDESQAKRHAGFFRNLYESKGGPVIDSETVFVLQKPQT